MWKSLFNFNKNLFTFIKIATLFLFVFVIFYINKRVVVLKKLGIVQKAKNMYLKF